MSKQTLNTVEMETNCTICLSDLQRELKDTSDLKCGHCFHSKCIL